MRTPAAILAVLLTTSCSSGSDTPPATSSTPSSTTTSAVAGAGRCQDVAADGQPVTDALIDKGCTDDKGSLRLGKVTVCQDGRRMWEMGELIGMSGETLLPKDLKAEGSVTAEMLTRRVCRG